MNPQRTKYVLLSGDELNVDLVLRTFDRMRVLGKIKTQLLTPDEGVRYQATDDKFVSPPAVLDSKDTAVVDTKAPVKRKQNKKPE